MIKPIDVALELDPPALVIAREAEESLIGCIAGDPARIDAIAETLTSSDFYDPALGAVFDAIAQLRLSGTRIEDPTLLIQQLRSMRIVDAVTHGGLTGLSALSQLIRRHYPVAYNAPVYANQVLRCSQLRRVQAVASDTLADTQRDAPSDPTELAEGAIAKLEAVIARDADHDAIELAEVTANEVDAILAACAAGKSLGLPSGLTSLDDCTGGFFPGELTVLGARPSIGKTALGMDLATRIASRGNPVLFVSLEMTGRQIAHRLLSRETGLPVKAIQQAALVGREGQMLEAAKQAMRDTPPPIKLLTAGKVTPQRIASRARIHKAQGGLSLIVVDYLGLLQSDQNHKTLYERVTALSRDMKLVAINLGVPVLLLAQLNRDGAKGLPTLEHLRDSGAIEQDADNVWLLHRDDRLTSDASLIVAKQRQGEIGTVDLSFDGASMSFSERMGAVWNG